MFNILLKLLSASGFGAGKQADRPAGFLGRVGMLIHSCYMHIDATLLSAGRITLQQRRTEDVGPAIDTGAHFQAAVRLPFGFADSDPDTFTWNTGHSFKM